MNAKKMISLGLVALVAMVALPLVAESGVVVKTIENFDNCPVGSYTDYGGIDLGPGTGYLTGWEVGGRYFTITNRDGLGNLDGTANNSNGNLCIGTKTATDSNRRKPVYEAAEALDFSASTYVKVTISNNNPRPIYCSQSGPPSGSPIEMWYYDQSAAITTSLVLGHLSDFGHPMPVGTVTMTYLLASYDPAFDLLNDRVFGFRTDLMGYRSDPGGDTCVYTWDSVTYDTLVQDPPPVPEPASVALMLLGLPLALRRRA